MARLFLNGRPAAGRLPLALVRVKGLALVHLTKVMAPEFAQKGVRVNVLCPDNIVTEMHEGLVSGGFTESLLKRFRNAASATPRT